MNRLLLVLLFVSAPLIARTAEPQSTSPPATTESASDKGAEQTMSVWMEKKLQHSQAILRGLAMGDFEDVKYNAGRLKVLNRVEGFVRRKNPTYRSHLNTFSRVSAEIERQAEKQNIEGATLAFNSIDSQLR